MDHTKELIERAHLGDRKARDMLVTDNLGLVYSVARRYLGRGYEMDDLQQIGTIGLMKAIDNFDLTKEVMFSTYAVPMISGEIKRYLRDDGLIKISRSIKENSWKIKQAGDEISKKNGHEATIEEIAQYTGISVEDVVVATTASKEVESIYQTVYTKDQNSIYLVDKLAADEELAAGDAVLNKIVLEGLLEDLSDNERRLIIMRYFEDKTQSVVAEKMGISQVQVSRLEKRILLNMRQKLEGKL